MKLLFFASAFGSRVPDWEKDVKASDDFGIVHVERGEYFRPGAEWVLQGLLKYLKKCKLKNKIFIKYDNRIENL